MRQRLNQNLHGNSVLHDLALPILHLFPLVPCPIPPVLSAPLTLAFFPLAYHHSRLIISCCTISPQTSVTRVNRTPAILGVGCPQLGSPFILRDVC